MIGSKPLTSEDIQTLRSELRCLRDETLFITGLYTGFRISELLSLTKENVCQYNEIRDSITVTRANMKGKLNSRTVVLHQEVKTLLQKYLSESKFLDDDKIFPISRVQACRIIREAAKRARIKGKVSSHSLRKSFAKRVYEGLNKDLISTQKAMGHKSVQSTISYLSFDQEKINKVIKSL